MGATTEDQKHEYLSPMDVGDLLGLSPITVRKLVQDKKLNTVENIGGLKRFSLEEIERFACENNITLIQPKDEYTRILIVDDDEILTAFMTELLSPYGHKIKTDYANNAEDAHAKIKSFKPHIILLDIMMPDLNGIDICNLLKLSPLSRSIRVIAITGSSNNDDINSILESGAETCLQKPVDKDQLLQAIGITL
ncbi:MAG: response regulator [Gammaproteobacteria bacterium]|nr:response regulator [Gammaproteobacteria bacterium]MDH5735834.1 response regulator [Gammaproteobacteria bacterium]